jgi:hypothetical protein
MNGFMCPVCGYDQLPAPAADYEICPSCATEFGYDDFTRSPAELRSDWLDAGAPWRATWLPEPPSWDGLQQLLGSGILGLDSNTSEASTSETESSNLRLERQVSAEPEYA